MSKLDHCKWPDHAVLIDPQGWIKPCCMVAGGDVKDALKLLDVTEESYKEHRIETATALDEYAYSDFNNYVRKEISEKGIMGADVCRNCAARKEKGAITHAEAFDWLNPDQSKYAPGKISYLEFTTSNICNQTCIMCSSYFSSKWATINHLFDAVDPSLVWGRGKNYNLSDSDIDKIIAMLPDIQTLHIKGGEPFSDLRNARILEELVNVNPDCKLWLTSNVSLISKKFMNILKKFNPDNVKLVASLDGIGKKYEWIRGTDFNQTLETLKKLHEECGIISKATPTVSYFNILDLPEIRDFYDDLPHTSIGKMEMKSFNLLDFPREMNYLYTRTQEELDTINMGIVSKFDQSLHDKLYQKIEIMNGIRGFRWQDC